MAQLRPRAHLWGVGGCVLAPGGLGDPSCLPGPQAGAPWAAPPPEAPALSPAALRPGTPVTSQFRTGDRGRPPERAVLPSAPRGTVRPGALCVPAPRALPAAQPTVRGLYEAELHQQVQNVIAESLPRGCCELSVSHTVWRQGGGGAGPGAQAPLQVCVCPEPVWGRGGAPGGRSSSGGQVVMPPSFIPRVPPPSRAHARTRTHLYALRPAPGLRN